MANERRGRGLAGTRPARHGVPSAVRRYVDPRSRTRIAQLSGKVLDLGGLDRDLSWYHRSPQLSLTVWAPLPDVASRILAEADRCDLAIEVVEDLRDLAGDRFDAALSILRLSALPDLGEVFGSVAPVLAGPLVFVEPTTEHGFGSRVLDISHKLGIGAQGRHLGRDVPAELRSAGFVPIELNRFAIPRGLWPMRTFVEGVAVVRA